MSAPDPLAAAKRLLASDPAAAIRPARLAHDRAATPETILLLAAACRRIGALDESLALLGPLAARLPGSWGVQLELGLARAGAGNLAGAIAALEQVTRLRPTALLARHALGDLRVATGVARGGASIAALDDPALLSAVAAMLDARPGAGETLAARFGLEPHDIAASCLVADVGLRIGRADAVARLLERGLGLAPRYRPAQLRLAEALHRAERDRPALRLIDEVLGDAPDLLPALALRGAILLRLGQEEQAADDLARVAAAHPDSAGAQLAHGHALRALGQRDAAIAAYRDALAADARSGEAYWSIADLKTGALDAGDRAAMRRLQGRGDVSAAARAQLDFALGRAFEEAGDPAAAFAHYAAGNAARRAIEPYDAAGHADFVTRSIAAMGHALLARRPAITEHAAAATGDPTPIFVVGMPRAGSSLVEQILASHSRIEGLSELPEITAIARRIAQYPEGLAALDGDDLAALGRDYLAALADRRRTDRPFVIDKFPGNAQHVALIHLILPDAQIVDVRRDARDCCVSLFAQHFAAGQGYSYDLGDLGRHYAGYVRMMTHIDHVLPGRVLRVRYEDLVDDVERETRRMLGHCGVTFEPQCLRFFDTKRAVRTASSEQVRQPLYRAAIGRWRRFEPWLGPLIEALPPGERGEIISDG